ncbi:MAG: Panacea domain-containing protein [Gammaproteobacteria bacterium WSBS_2016_MAG_OTU1]
MSAHGWHLGYTDEPLISDTIEAWKFGPVVPLTYRTFRDSSFVIRDQAINPETKNFYSADLSEETKNIVIDVYKEYSKKSAWSLSHTTHHESSPWYKYRREPCAHIPNEEIKAYYKEIIKSMNAKSDSESS